MSDTRDKRGSHSRRMGHLYVQGIIDAEEGRKGPPLGFGSMSGKELDVYQLGRNHSVTAGLNVPVIK